MSWEWERRWSREQGEGEAADVGRGGAVTSPGHLLCARQTLSPFYLGCLVPFSPQPCASVIYSALTEKETETRGCYVTRPRSHSLSGAKPASQPRSVCLQWVLCCQQVLLLEKQVWSWGFQSELIRLPRGKSIVICPPPPHPSARRVAGEPPAKAPAPAPGASSAEPGSPPLPGAPKVALRSLLSPVPPLLPFQVTGSTGKAGREGRSLEGWKQRLWSPTKDWGSWLSPSIQTNPSLTPAPPPQRQPELCLVNEIQKEESGVGVAPELWKARERGKVGPLPKS